MSATRSTAGGLFAAVFPTAVGVNVHGNNRRGVAFTIDTAAIEACWRRTEASRASYHADAPWGRQRIARAARRSA